MPHVELSLIDSRRLPRSRPPHNAVPCPPDAPPPGLVPELTAPYGSSLRRWTAVVTGATEPCLVLDQETVILAASASCAEMLGCGDVAGTLGRQMRDAVTQLVDFTDPPDKLDSAEAGKTPPLLALSSHRLARGLMRVKCPESGRTCIMDAVATPLWEDGAVVGSLTFFSRV